MLCLSFLDGSFGLENHDTPLLAVYIVQRRV